MVEGTSTTWTMRTRAGMLPIVLWAFGFATSLLLIGMWGRAVTIDNDTIQESAAAIIDSDLATERVYTWLEAGIRSATGTDEASAREVATAVAARPEFDHAVDVMVDEFIASLFAEPGATAQVDLDRALSPLIPVIAAEANRKEIPVEPAQLETALDAAGVIELDTGEAASVVTVVDEARTFLTKVVLLAGFLLLVTGVLAVVLSETRYAMIRSLSTRVVISALSYALMFRVAAWALDPSKGRSPLLDGGSVLIGSNGHVFVIAAIVAALIGTWGGAVAWRRKTARRAVGAISIPDTGDRSDDDTREFAPV